MGWICPPLSAQYAALAIAYCRSDAQQSAKMLIKSHTIVGETRSKIIAFDDDTFDKLKQLARDRMATLQELADEAFADLLRKHGIPVDLKDALRKSAALTKAPAPRNARSGPARKSKA
jgi:non-homologous end joining protein Ku